MERAEARGSRTHRAGHADAGSETQPPHVVVVGGGIAGLVAARQLAVGGARVTLLEASAVLGGKVARHTVAGIAARRRRGELRDPRRHRGGVRRRARARRRRSCNPTRPAPGCSPRDGAAVPLPEAGLLGIPGTPLAADVIAVDRQARRLRAQLDSLLGYVGHRSAPSASWCGDGWGGPSSSNWSPR